MGAGPSLPRVHINVDSPSIAGLKTCVSDPLDQYCTRDEFFAELLSMLREPVAPYDIPYLKDLKVEDIGPTECSIKVLLDGLSLQEIGSPEQSGTKDVVRMWLRLTWDLDRYEMCIHTNDTATGKATSSIRIHFLKDPFRIETLFILNPQNADASLLAWVAENQWIRPVVWEFIRRKVKMSRNVESPYGNGSMVTITEPLDDFLDYDTLWEGFLTHIKQKSVYCEELSDTQFEVTIVDPTYGGSEKKHLIRLIKHDKSKGEITDVSSVDNLRLVDTRNIRIHRDPLRVEHWTEAGGKRIYKRLNSEFLQWFLDEAVGNRKKGKSEEADGGGCVTM